MNNKQQQQSHKYKQLRMQCTENNKKKSGKKRGRQKERNVRARQYRVAEHLRCSRCIKPHFWNPEEDEQEEEAEDEAEQEAVKW